MGFYIGGNTCSVCGTNDFFCDEKNPYEHFCEHCFEVLDNWFDELSCDLRTSVKAWQNREITETEVLEALEMFIEQKGMMIHDSSNNR